MGSSNALEPRGLYSSMQWSVRKRTVNSFYPLQEAKEKILNPLLPQVGLWGWRINHMTQLLKPYLRVFFCLGLNSGCSLSYRVRRVAQFTINEKKFKSSHECKQEDSFLSNYFGKDTEVLHTWEYCSAQRLPMLVRQVFVISKLGIWSFTQVFPWHIWSFLKTKPTQQIISSVNHLFQSQVSRVRMNNNIETGKALGMEIKCLKSSLWLWWRGHKLISCERKGACVRSMQTCLPM